MSSAPLDVVGVGNAIVDVLAKCEEAFLARHAVPKGGMILIDEDQAEGIYGEMAQTVEVSGGSAANSIACLASLGGKGGFVGKVADDILGQTFTADLRDQGVDYTTAPLTDGPGTGRCLINVTSDAQRSMATYLGAAVHVTLNDIDEEQITRAAITFFEGYLFEQPVAREAFVKACAIAAAAGRRTAMTLSDAGCVDRQHDVLKSFIPNHVDILLANEVEAQTLFETDNRDEMIRRAPDWCALTAVTLGEEGSLIIPRDGAAITVPAIAPTKLEDTTGAGDAFAAGFLFGVARDFDLQRSASLGALAASEVISHMGPRPEQSLKALAEKADL
ncbi:MAG: adenosine kinase [Pseudomonadota bacterium]